MGRCGNLVSLFCLLVLPQVTWAETLYVTPRANISCDSPPGVPCHTLSEYADQALDGISNLTMLFMEGEHDLPRNFSLSGLDNLNLRSLTLNEEVLISCSYDGKLLFADIDDILIESMKMVGCYGNSITDSEHVAIENTYVQGFPVNSTESTFYVGRVQDFEVVNSTFASNEAVALEPNKIGCSVLHVTNSNVKVLSSVFDQNFAGAAAYVLSSTICFISSNITMANSSFTRNSADTGGAVYAEHSAVTALDCVFANNHATSKGGVAFLTYSNLTLDSCVLSENNSSEIGGAVYVQSSSTITALGTTFAHNYAATGGGVLYMLENTYLNLDSCILSNNTCNFRGGGVFADKSTLTAVGTVFANNYAASDGGVVYMYRTTSLTLDNCTFIENTCGPEDGASKGVGGVVYSDESTVTALGTTFTRNHAAYFGGVVYMRASNLTLDHCPFSENSCGLVGGVLYITGRSDVEAWGAEFHYNYVVSDDADFNGGHGVMWLAESHATFVNCTFTGNKANDSGTLTAYISKLYVENCFFSNNSANSTNKDKGAAAVLRIEESYASIRESTFLNNFAQSGGCGYVRNSILHVAGSCLFQGNSAEYGGAFTIWDSNLHLNHQNFTCDELGQIEFVQNSAHLGGALNIFENSVAHIQCTTFKSNRAEYVSFQPANDQYRGGAILVRSNATTHLVDTTFYGNSANGKGGILFAQFSNIKGSGFLIAEHNRADNGSVYIVSCLAQFTGTLAFTNNEQSFFTRNCHVFFSGESTFSDGISDHEEGGALTATRSTITTSNTFSMRNNSAQKFGGGIYLTESVLNIKGQCTFVNNFASISGGAMYAYKSEVNVSGNTILQSNTATRNGGGIFLGRSTLSYCSHFLSILDNKAWRGGAIYLDQTSILFIVKEQMECEEDHWYCSDEWLLLTFSGNSADNAGGALYVNDNSSTSCGSRPYATDNTCSECFIQTVAVYERDYDWDTATINYANIVFENNTADNGSLLYGGLLDRCAVDPFAEFKENNTIPHPLSYFKALSRTDISNTELASLAVQVCFCDDNFEIDCSNKVRQESIQRGQIITVTLIAVDQVETPLASYVLASLSSESSRLNEDQSKQWIEGVCTELNFTVFSSESVTLSLYADGPCDDQSISQVDVHVDIALECPMGFSLSNTSLECVCEHDPEFRKYIKEDDCSIETKSIWRRRNIWISSVVLDDNMNITENDTGIILHEYCPYDYCLPPTKPVAVNLNIKDGSDKQCAPNRHGNICGCCSPNTSLTLGSSQCKECTNYSLFLIIPFGLAGIGLVVLMMVCNLTLAAGTLNGLLFYANILIANQASFFPFQRSVLTVFVSWLGLNLGIATCFYNGMNGLEKMWIQISFELYLIVLMFAIILLGRNVKVANLLSRGNLHPVHTLATLVMLSYEKLSRKVFSLVAYTKLEYPNGTSDTVWLIDPCLNYMEKEHIPLFIVGVLIVVTGIIFNFILLFNKMLIARCRSVYFNSFMEAFYAPFKPNHQYWVGLLLLIRNISYFTSEFFYAGENPSYNLHFIFSLVIGLLLIKLFYVSMPSWQYILSGLKGWILWHKHESVLEDSFIAVVRDGSDGEDNLEARREPVPVKTMIHGIVYKSPYLDLLETSFLINLLILTYFTLYLHDENKEQNILFNISSSVVLVTFVGILIYHVVVYTRIPRLVTKCKQPVPPAEEQRVPLVTSNDCGYGSNASPSVSELPNPETAVL